MNRKLAKTIVAVFQVDDPVALRERLAEFDERDWSRTTKWLHTSGLALYFLGRARTLGIEDAMPSRIAQELKRNLAENRARTACLFAEFVDLNVEFQRANLSYANLKGFTLLPHSCSDPAYRYQHDLDVLVSQSDAERCRKIMEKQGYRLTAVFGDTLEFRAGAAEVASMRDLYKPRLQRSVEVHLEPEDAQSASPRSGNRLSRMQLQVWNGFEFPALAESDKLLGQALHLFKHFQTEWTRTAWLLEYAASIRSHRYSESLWQETIAAIEAAPETKTGIGLTTLIAMRTFGATPPTRFVSCTVDEMPDGIRRWADLYEDDLVYLEFPGSKLYLLLQDILREDRTEWRSQRRRKLIPLRLPPPTTRTMPTDGIGLRMKVAWVRFCFLCKRSSFHVVASVRYKIEAARWKKSIADLRA